MLGLFSINSLMLVLCNCQRSTVSGQLSTVNCQLSTVHRAS
ncbi:hypothetical protein [Microcoleus sp. PH2017_32_RDM_D_A]|nr:hypothetical protein [Microcoleus sp. PH2017_32_RDM_D_A]